MRTQRGSSHSPLRKSMNSDQQTVAVESAGSDFHHLTPYPNKWSRCRDFIKEPAAEFMGTAILVLFGVGGQCQVALSQSVSVAPTPRGDYLSSSFGWGIGLAMGVWISGGISGGHLNPAVTLSLAALRGFRWKKVPVYMLSQLLGGIVGAALVYGIYHHAIDNFEGGSGIRTLRTAGLFGTLALDYLSNATAFFTEFLATAVLVGLIFAISDKKNVPPPTGLSPLFFFLILTGISISLGMGTGFAVNPARDLGPRILTSMVGYGKSVYTFRNQYWLWCPVIGPFLGGLAGGALYDILFFTGQESIFNAPNKEVRTRHLHAASHQEPNAPSGARPDEVV